MRINICMYPEYTDVGWTWWSFLVLITLTIFVHGLDPPVGAPVTLLSNSANIAANAGHPNISVIEILRPGCCWSFIVALCRFETSSQTNNFKK